MIRGGVNSPMASSCGRLFDAMAAALGICRDRQSHEGEAASRLEALVCQRTLYDEDDALAYPFASTVIRHSRASGNPVRPTANRPGRIPACAGMTGRADLHRSASHVARRARRPGRRTPHGVIAARFHKGLAIAIVGDDACSRPARMLRHSGAVRRLLSERRAVRADRTPTARRRVQRADTQHGAGQ